MRLEWVWLFTRWYAEIVNQSARRDDTRRDAPLRYVRPASYCEPGFSVNDREKTMTRRDALTIHIPEL